MTPKEKSEELFNNFYQATEDHWNQEPVSKECALIAVDEMLNTLNYDIKDLDVRGSILLDLIEYWQEVKTEIHKL